MAKPFSELIKDVAPEIRRRAEAEAESILEEMRIGEIRRAFHLTQVEMAERMGVSQAAISKLENQPDMLLSTLRKYFDRLDAELVLTVRVNGHDVVLTNPNTLDSETASASPSELEDEFAT